jgi:hypothetical protein
VLNYAAYGSAFVRVQRHRCSGHQFIAARVSYEERRVGGILFYFLAQTIDMRLKCVGCNPRIVTPDSEPDKRGTRCWLAYGSVVSSIPEVGAVCGKAARTDLCGGREATRVPTAKTQAPVWAADGPRQRAQARVHHLTGS